MVRLMLRKVCVGEYASEQETRQARRYYRRAGIRVTLKWEGNRNNHA